MSADQETLTKLNAGLSECLNALDAMSAALKAADYTEEMYQVNKAWRILYEIKLRRKAEKQP